LKVKKRCAITWVRLVKSTLEPFYAVSVGNVYGVYLDKDGMMLGSKRFDVDNSDNIFVNGVWYIGTPGLYELIFKRMLDEDVYTEDGIRKYKTILLTTNVHRRNHDADGQLRSNRGYKYKHVIAPLLPNLGRKNPEGNYLALNDNAIDYVHWDDPNELVDRLRLLETSHQADHNAHDNEILSIIGISRSRSYYKLTRVSPKRISRSMITRIEKNANQ